MATATQARRDEAVAEIATGAIFTDGEPGVRTRRAGAFEGPALLVAMTILDATGPIGHAVALYEHQPERDAEPEVEDLRERIRRLGGTPRFERVEPIKAPREPVRFVVRHLLACQAELPGSEATRSGSSS